jgi:hypothetical protein
MEEVVDKLGGSIAVGEGCVGDQDEGRHEGDA